LCKHVRNIVECINRGVVFCVNMSEILLDA
jgi:hypothetical protein